MRSQMIGALLLASCTSLAHADNQKPTVPDNVTATALDDSSVRVSWNRSLDDVGVDGYNIYKEGSYYATVFGTTNFIDTNVSPGTRYEYSVVAFDRARNYTVLSASAVVTPGGDGATGAAPPSSGGAPSAPSSVSASSRGDSGVALSWEATPGAAGYNVYFNGIYRTTVRGSDWTDTGVDGDDEHRYSVVAFSSDAQYSTESDEVSTRPSDDDAPAAEDAAPPQAQAQRASGGSAPDGYNLVFSDEFGGGDIDSSKWNSSYRWGPSWTINNEEQYYVDSVGNPDFGYSPFSFDGNNMTISATRTPDYLKASANNKNYLSGALTTYDKFKMRYGYVEMRAKMPPGKGLWSALWLLHQNEAGTRPEIDIVEFIGDEKTVANGTYHYFEGYNLRSTPTYRYTGADLTQGFHTYAMKWEASSITWYVDGREFSRYEGGGVPNEDMYLLVNLALGGSWAGSPDGSTPFPANYAIDYIRVYTRG